MTPMTPRAFTLMETIVVIALTGIVGVGLFMMIAYFYRSNTYLIEAVQATESASEGIVVTLESLREATYGEDGSYPLAVAATSSVTFYADLDLDDSVERVRLYVQNGTLYRSLTEPSGNPPGYAQAPSVTTIATYVKNGTSTPAFRYYDRNGVELTGAVDIAEVRTVRTRFDVDINPLRAPNVVTFEGAATLRNVRHAD